MRPPSGGYQELSSGVLLPQTPRYMAPLHSGSPLTPVSLAAQSFTLSLPLVQIQMPLISNELQWQSRTLLSRERRTARRMRRNRVTNVNPPVRQRLWHEVNRGYNPYMGDQQRVETTTVAISQPPVQIESHRSSIASVPSTITCRLTSDATQGTNIILTDSIDMEVDQRCSMAHNFDSEKSDKIKEGTAGVSCEPDSYEDMSLPLDSLRVLSTPTMLPQPTAAARRMASKIIRHARYNKIPNEQEMCCTDCGLIPILPVTGQCGHTRCTKCIKDKGACSCGAPEPDSLHVNTLVQDIIAKMVRHCPLSRGRVQPVSMRWSREQASAGSLLPPVTLQRATWCNSKRNRRFARSSTAQTGEMSGDAADGTQPTPMSMQARYDMGRKLITLGRYRDAAPHLAHVAASTEAAAKQARTLLAQAITVMSGNRECRRLTRELYRGVRSHAATAWLKTSDLECILCCSTFTEPVTTPCGHTYCRTCIERSLDYRKKCALCLRSLDNFNLSVTGMTTFVSAALTSIDALSPPLLPEPDVIPIFVCTVAYPAIPCPLFIFDPRYWLMVRRVLESGSRKFGMVAYERDRSYSNYGTILKVCDCVHLEDGRSILSTVGLSRFRVIERHVRDGCDVARIEPLTDLVPADPVMIWELQVTAAQICYKALMWLNSMNKSIYSEIEATFGRMPKMDCLNSNWWETPDGPAWMWWLIAILPLKSEIKMLILSTPSLLKRMTAIYRTLEAIDQITTTDIELARALNTAQDWLLHGS